MIYLNSNMTASEKLEAIRPYFDMLGVPTDWIEALVDNESDIDDARGCIPLLEDARLTLPGEGCLEDIVVLARKIKGTSELIEALEAVQTELTAGDGREGIDKALALLEAL